MAYQANIPLATDALSKSQADIQGNFQAIEPLVLAGLGQYSIFASQVGAPAVAASQFAMYESIGANAQQQLFLKRNPATVAQIPAVLAPGYDFTVASYTTGGYTRLPSGILMKWGIGGAYVVNGLQVINYNNTIPFTAVLNVQVTPQNSTNADVNIYARFVSTTTTQLSVYISQRTSSSAPIANPCAVYYLAIGY